MGIVWQDWNENKLIIVATIGTFRKNICKNSTYFRFIS